MGPRKIKHAVQSTFFFFYRTHFSVYYLRHRTVEHFFTTLWNSKFLSFLVCWWNVILYVPYFLIMQRKSLPEFWRDHPLVSAIIYLVFFFFFSSFLFIYLFLIYDGEHLVIFWNTIYWLYQLSPILYNGLYQLSDKETWPLNILTYKIYLPACFTLIFWKSDLEVKY